MEVNKLLEMLVNDIANKVISGLLAKMNTAEAITRVNTQLKTAGSEAKLPTVGKIVAEKPITLKPETEKSVAKKPVAKKIEKAEPEPEPEPEPVTTEPVALELADIRVVAVALKRAGKNVKKLIQSFGVEKLSDIKPEKRAEFLAAAEEMQGEK